MQLVVANAEQDHLEGMVECHLAAFPGQFLSLLGRRFVRAFYRFYLERPQSISLVAVDGATGRVVGLVVGGEPELRSQFTRRCVPRFALLLAWRAVTVRAARRRLLEHFGSVARRLWHRVRRDSRPRAGEPPAEPKGTWGSLLSICTHPEHQGQGIGRALLDTFREVCRQRGYRSARLSVHNDNTAAIALYQRNGWQVLLVTPRGTYFRLDLEPRT
jgi:ribosomal protein S18 acetylase RimI-like enzyme